MNIRGIPEMISHTAWLSALELVGFSPAEAGIKSITTEDEHGHLRGRAWMVVETHDGNVLRVPFDFSREA